MLAAGLVASGRDAWGQALSARRMAMGGVMLGSPGDNVAYQAVPEAPGRVTGFTFPIGLLDVAANPPTFDPNDPGFNIFEIADLVMNPPWNYTLSHRDPPSSDVTVSLGKDHLAVDLGDLKGALPNDRTRMAFMQSVTPARVGIGPFFTGIAVITHYQNDLHLNDALEGALAHGEEFHPSTEYAVIDTGLGQVLAAWEVGAAAPLWGAAHKTSGRGAKREPAGLYGGARVSFLRGLGYGDTRNVASFVTEDTLFATVPAQFDYTGDFRDAGASGGGFGAGVDLGAVYIMNGYSFGAAVNHLGSTVKWRGRSEIVRRDSLGDYQTTTLDDNAHWTSRLPVTGNLNGATLIRGTLVAADLAFGMAATQTHLGVEHWFGPLAVRAGGRLDENTDLQGSTGVGARWRSIGLDVAVATKGRTIPPKRSVELGVGLSFYH